MALGRALVRDPLAFLMDEPLSNLDAKLRVQMRSELKRFHQDLNATVIYVTHDQLEAVTMADKMAVMNGGVLQQYDAPERVFAQPGEYVRCRLRRQPGDEPGAARRSLATPGGAALEGAGGWRCELSPSECAEGPGGERWLRHTRRAAQHDHCCTRRRSPGAIPSRVYTVEPTGDITYVHVFLGNRSSSSACRRTCGCAPIETVWIEFDQERLHLFDAATEQALRAD